MQIDDDTWFFVSGVLMDLSRQRDRLDMALSGLMIAPESPLHEPFSHIANLLIYACSELIRDDFQHLSWYVDECDFGRDPKKAGCVGEMKLIDTHERLRWLIETECKP